MEITPERWEHIQSRADILQHQAPMAVVLSIAPIIGDKSILASWPLRQIGKSTTRWTCWVVTSTALGYVHVEYQHENVRWYDEHTERTANALNSLTPSSQSAWVRPLASIIGLRYGAYYADQRQKDSYLPAEPMHVIFPDDQFAIPHCAEFSVDDREIADEFARVLRQGVNF